MFSLRPARVLPVTAFRQVLRQAGLDTNPLRRDLDYVQTWVTMLLVVVFVAAGPIISAAVRHATVHAGMTALRLGIGAVTQLTLGLLLWDVRRVVRWVLDRRRLARWERMWELVEPRWSGR